MTDCTRQQCGSGCVIVDDTRVIGLAVGSDLPGSIERAVESAMYQARAVGLPPPQTWRFAVLELVGNEAGARFAVRAFGS